MPRPGPRRPNTAVRLSEETTAALDTIAADRGITRSDVIREAVEQYLALSDDDALHEHVYAWKDLGKLGHVYACQDCGRLGSPP